MCTTLNMSKNNAIIIAPVTIMFYCGFLTLFVPAPTVGISF